MNKILIEVPTWLGDCVMITPTIEGLVQAYPHLRIIIFGSYIATEVFANHPNVERLLIDESRTAKNRYIWLYRTAKTLKVDVVFSFRRRFSSKFFAYFVTCQQRFYYQRLTNNAKHQVLRYCDFLNQSLGLDIRPGVLKIHLPFVKKSFKKTLGINPGASYGSAKRWYPEEFAKVACALSAEYDIKIFGGKNEQHIAQDIEKALIENGVKNYQNLVAKTSISTLLTEISQLDLFITGDSGPMHIAAAFQVPTVAIFGPTKTSETSQWKNEKSIIVKKDLSCQPCMQRSCRFKHHDCMKNIKADEVICAVKSLVK
jgi:heptosyltransferase-2